jgi:aspartyl-tRNA(Asn)/glutamyl-tRNA(Gln) amidotransferase subunit B
MSDKVTIGLEIHAPLATRAKLFCACPIPPKDAAPNTVVCEVCAGQPGAKPMAVSGTALEAGLKLALALECRPAKGALVVLRKHYFYPDLPSGYQRTSLPIAAGGMLEGVRIREVHIEEDPGNYELRDGRVDYNRSGTPLAEVVTEPDLTSPEQARRFLESLQAVFSYLGAVRAEPGSMRVDANISLPGGNRVEVKNINSFKGVETALRYEVARQRALLSQGLAVAHETRHFDEREELTLPLRKKELAADYRFLPDPDLPPLPLRAELVEKVRKGLPELPAAKRRRFLLRYGVGEEEAFVLTLEPEFAQAFEETVKLAADAKLVARLMRGVVRKQLNYRSRGYRDSGLTPALLAELAGLVRDGKATEKVAEQALVAFLDRGESPARFVEAQGLAGVVGGSELERAVREAIAANAEAAASFRAGNEKAVHFLAGEVMKRTRKRAEPGEVQALLRRALAAQA